MTKRKATRQHGGGPKPKPRPIPYDAEALGARLEDRARRQRRKKLWPVGLAEWQMAADGASFALALESCRLYGLITGGPAVNVDRCELILARALEHNVTPRPLEDLIPELLPAFVAETPISLEPGLAALDAGGRVLEAGGTLDDAATAAADAALEVLDNPPADPSS